MPRKSMPSHNNSTTTVHCTNPPPPLYFLGNKRLLGDSLIGRVCAATGATSYGDAWAKTVGKRTAWLPTSSCTFKTFFACMIYSIIIGKGDGERGSLDFVFVPIGVEFVDVTGAWLLDLHRLSKQTPAFRLRPRTSILQRAR